MVLAAAGDGVDVVYFEFDGVVGGWGAAAESALVVVAFEDFEAEGEGGAAAGAALADGGASGEEFALGDVALVVEVVEMAGSEGAAPGSDEWGSGDGGVAIDVGGTEGGVVSGAAVAGFFVGGFQGGKELIVGEAVGLGGVADLFEGGSPGAEALDEDGGTERAVGLGIPAGCGEALVVECF